MIESDSLVTYNRVSNIQVKLDPPFIPPYTPVITAKDRQRGEIFRYFSKFATHSTSDITEISKQVYSQLVRNPMYITVKIRWKISGNLDDIKLPLNNLPNKDIIIPGVISFNENSLEFGNETIPGLTYHITNPVQFWTPPV